MTSKELKGLCHLRREIRYLEGRIAELEARAEGGGRLLTGLPGAGRSGDRLSYYASKAADLQCRLTRLHARCVAEAGRLTAYIEGIEDSRTRRIFTLRYMDGLSWAAVARNMGGAGDGSTERKIHDRFLKFPGIPD